MLGGPDSFPVVNSSCIMRAFAAIHIDSVMFSNFGFPFCALITILAPPELPISCSSSLLARLFTITKSGINSGFSPPLAPCAAFAFVPRNTCRSLSKRGRWVSVASSVSKGSSMAPMP